MTEEKKINIDYNLIQKSCNCGNEVSKQISKKKMGGAQIMCKFTKNLQTMSCFG